MKIAIDTTAGTVTVGEPPHAATYPLGSGEGFAAVSKAWLRAGWDAKYVYSFTWLGRPIIQLPEDMIRLQEIIVTLAPDVIIETGVAHGGALVFYSSLCRMLGRGRVIGVDVHIRPHNRSALEAHPMVDRITLIEGSSIDLDVVAQIRSLINPGDRVLVTLDSNHTKEHVLAELEAYAPLVTPGSYIVAMDGIMADVAGAPRTAPDWTWNNPREAAAEFVTRNPSFVIDEPPFAFNEGSVTERVTYWPSGFLKRVR